MLRETKESQRIANRKFTYKRARRDPDYMPSEKIIEYVKEKLVGLADRQAARHRLIGKKKSIWYG